MRQGKHTISPPSAHTIKQVISKHLSLGKARDFESCTNHTLWYNSPLLDMSVDWLFKVRSKLGEMRKSKIPAQKRKRKAVICFVLSPDIFLSSHLPVMRRN
jgi:hypothetical protein